MRSSAQRDRCTRCSAAKKSACVRAPRPLRLRPQTGWRRPPHRVAGSEKGLACAPSVLTLTGWRYALIARYFFKTRTDRVRHTAAHVADSDTVRTYLTKRGQGRGGRAPRTHSRGPTRRPWSWGTRRRPCRGRPRWPACPRQRGCPPARLRLQQPPLALPLPDQAGVRQHRDMDRLFLVLPLSWGCGSTSGRAWSAAAACRPVRRAAPAGPRGKRVGRGRERGGGGRRGRHPSPGAAWPRAAAGRAGACRRAARPPRGPAASGSTAPPGAPRAAGSAVGRPLQTCSRTRSILPPGNMLSRCSCFPAQHRRATRPCSAPLTQHVVRASQCTVAYACMQHLRSC